jgi:3,4-dihydroxy-9,10-secoandrosta-1,3,5(10)-triene-9,17-dione 4,5-dioxygenase
MDLHGLGYIGLTAPDPLAWLAFATDIVGMMPARALPGESYGAPTSGEGPASGGSGLAADGSVYLKMDERQWRVGVHPGEQPGIAYLGFEVADAPALDAACTELTEKGVAVTVESEAVAATRGVAGLATLADPAGNRVELFHGLVTDFHFASPRGVEFLTDPYGMGHTLFMVPEMEPALDFYTNALGFRRSDYIKMGPGMTAQFLRCTPRHHSVALAFAGPFSAVHHVMFEMREIDQVGRALDRAQAAGLEITSTIGRHSNDGMFSFYVRSPAGFDVEVGCQGRIVDDATWAEREFVEGDTWGHHGLTPEALQAAVAGE